ncbi:MAG: hypothetical protein CVU64_00485 [Deltaproteobacteria bacterium HGW-Deltaproteobacteria-21]|nr:MAG: hypothetical protein CVU64_00485 [Deltaproteobacteria bacterium HGW-Deltaproteobacteria-21]
MGLHIGNVPDEVGPKVLVLSGGSLNRVSGKDRPGKAGNHRQENLHRTGVINRPRNQIPDLFRYPFPASEVPQIS